MLVVCVCFRSTCNQSDSLLDSLHYLPGIKLVFFFCHFSCLSAYAFLQLLQTRCLLMLTVGTGIRLILLGRRPSLSSGSPASGIFILVTHYYLYPWYSSPHTFQRATRKRWEFRTQAASLCRKWGYQAGYLASLPPVGRSAAHRLFL